MNHPCTYSKQLFPVLREQLAGARRVLDPFAGIGTYHKLLPEGAHGVGVEIEPEWAAQHPNTTHGDSHHLVAMFGIDSFDHVVSSPVYPNGCADNFRPADTSRRYTYRAALGGRPLTDGSTAGVGRGLNRKHNTLHTAIAHQVALVLQPDGKLIWNVKDVIVAGKVVPVVAWWETLWAGLGLRPIGRVDVPCPGIRHGTNSAARVDTEAVLIYRKPR